MKLGVPCVSVYAFAIENFKRPQDEVAALMRLAEVKLVEICQHGCVLMVIFTSENNSKIMRIFANRELLDKYGVRLNVIGKTELLPPAVQAAVKRAEDLTRSNDKCVSFFLKFFLTHQPQFNAERFSTFACLIHPLTK